jgi:hypothetical protein
MGVSPCVNAVEILRYISINPAEGLVCKCSCVYVVGKTRLKNVGRFI